MYIVINVAPEVNLITLRTDINVRSGINVRTGNLGENNKRTVWNKHTGGKIL